MEYDNASLSSFYVSCNAKSFYGITSSAAVYGRAITLGNEGESGRGLPTSQTDRKRSWKKSIAVSNAAPTGISFLEIAGHIQFSEILAHTSNEPRTPRKVIA